VIFGLVESGGERSSQWVMHDPVTGGAPTFQELDWRMSE